MKTPEERAKVSLAHLPTLNGLNKEQYLTNQFEEAISEQKKQIEMLREALRVTAIRTYNIGQLSGHEDTVEARFVLVMPQDLHAENADVVGEMLTDGSLPEAQRALQSTTPK